MLYIIFPIVIVAAVTISFRVIYAKRVNQTMQCSEGKFSVRGTKKRFTIRKGKRFIFIVENGRIVAVKDKSASSKRIEYGGH